MDATAILKTYSGEKIKLDGKLIVPVEQNNQVKDLKLYVVRTRACIVWKRLATQNGNWKQICAFSKEKPLQSTQKKLEKLLDENSAVF